MRDSYTQKMIAKLRIARNEIEDVLALAAFPPQYDPVVMGETRDKELRDIVEDLNRMLLELEGMP